MILVGIALLTTQSNLNLELVASSARNVMKVLSEKTGTKHVAAAEVADEILVIRASNVKAQDLRQEIAAATSAEWKIESDGTFALWRSPKRREVLEKYERAMLKDEISSEIRRLGEIVAKPYTTQDAQTAATQNEALSKPDEEFPPYDGQGASQLKTPTKRALIKILQLIDPESLVLAEEERRVFATTPTKQQMPLDKKALELARSMCEEQAIWSKAVSDLPSVSPTRVWSHPLFHVKPFTFEPSRVLLIVQRSVLSNNLAIQLYVVDGQDAVRAVSNLWLTTQRSRDWMAANQKFPADDGQLELSKRAHDFEALLHGFRRTNTSDRALLTPTHLDIYLHPEENDILSYGVSEGLLQNAKNKNINLVANLPDFAFAATGMQLPLPSPTGLYNRVVSLCELQAEMKMASLVLRPPRPLESAYARENRAAMGEIMRYRHEHGFVPLWLSAKRATLNSMRGNFGEMLSLIMLPDSVLPASHDWKYLKLYGLLTKSQQSTLLEGGSIPFGELGASARKQLERITFGDDSFTFTQRPAGPTEDPPVRTLETEPTEFLANGLPSSGAITSTPSSGKLLIPIYEADASAFSKPRSYSVSRLAFDTVALEKKSPNAPSEPLPTKFRIAEEIGMRLTLVYTPERSRDAVLKELKMEDRRIYSMENLPLDIKAELKTLAEQYRKMNWETGGAKVPPPRP